MNAPLRLYDLAGADEDLRFSPNCWRTPLAFAHKGLPVETVAWRFTDKEAIAASGQGNVPVLVDGDRWLHESWLIAEHLEDAYPDRPSLFGSAQGRALARFVNQRASETPHPAVARVIVPDIMNVLHEKDRDYFRTSREAAFGCTFEVLEAPRDEALAALRRIVAPLRSTLAALPRRRRAELCRSCGLRRVPVGARGQSGRTGADRRSDLRLERGVIVPQGHARSSRSSSP